MGWRALLRSIGKLSRQKKREEEHHKRSVTRAKNQANRYLESLSNEAERDAQRIQKFEGKLYAKPVRTLKLSYSSDGSWHVEPFVDRTGNIKFSYAPSFSSEKVDISPSSVLFEGREFEVKAVSVSKYATMVAMCVRLSKEAKGSKSRRLVSSKNPSNSHIAIVVGEKLFYPIDGNIDGRLINGVVHEGLVAFEPFSESIDHFQLTFMPKETKKNPKPSPIPIDVAGKELKTSINKALNSKSAVENYQAYANRQINSERRKMQRQIDFANLPSCSLSTILYLVFMFIIVGSCLDNGEPIRSGPHRKRVERTKQRRRVVAHSEAPRIKKHRTISKSRVEDVSRPKIEKKVEAEEEETVKDKDNVEVKWLDTDTHRVKVKVVNGKEVGRWRFLKKKFYTDTSKTESNAKSKVVEKVTHEGIFAIAYVKQDFSRLNKVQREKLAEQLLEKEQSRSNFIRGVKFHIENSKEEEWMYLPKISAQGYGKSLDEKHETEVSRSTNEEKKNTRKAIRRPVQDTYKERQWDRRVREVERQTFIGNDSSKKFHKPSCSFLPDPSSRVYFSRKAEALRSGYIGCKKCNP